VIRFPSPPDGAPDDLKTAIRRFESGLYRNAIDHLLKVLATSPSHALAAHYLVLANRRLAPRPATKPTLVWQFPPDGAWETDWLRELFGDSISGEVVDNTWSKMIDPMIVVDNRLVPEKIAYYRDAFRHGCRVILVHLSDEAFKDDLGAYQYCDAVLRNYHSERLAAYAAIKQFPLGYKAGFLRSIADKPATTRTHLWSFAGDANKHGRAEMLHAFNQLPGGFIHATSGFGAADALPTTAYRTLMDETLFAPCPGGWSSLDTFRVYEALEAGCIPIVERRPGFDYFTRLMGSHPIPTVDDWRSAAAFIRTSQSNDTAEHLRLACRDWWRAHKKNLKGEIAAFVATALT